MLFRVQNLGPLRDAEVDLSKDILVLAGPNNSGKTYLAWTVYGLHRMRPQADVDLSRWVKQLVESPDHSIDIAEFLAAEKDTLLNALATSCKAELNRCFAADEALFAQSNIEIRELDFGSLLNRKSVHVSQLGGADHTYILVMQAGRVTWILKPQNQEFNSFLNNPFMEDFSGAHRSTVAGVEVLSPQAIGDLMSSINLRLVAVAVADLLPHCTLFPAERIAVNIFAKELALERTKLVDELIDVDLGRRGQSPLDLIRSKAGRYPWPIRDSLRIANDLANLKKEKSPFADLADELESGVLRGSVSVADTGELRFAPNDNKQAHLEMHLTASVVKSLSSVVFYFRHLARPHDFIIIDEPELNLHPDNQRIITRILAKAARRGIKIMMSTHSDYVLRELNHLIMLGKLPEDEAKAMGYDPEWSIAPDRIGVYLFDEHTAKPVPIEDTGFSIKTIDDVVDRLNADEQRLYARLFG